MRDIERFYGGEESRVRALDGVSFEIYPGEFIAIMGQSGSGKSTLMNIMGCLDRANAGAYEINGDDVENLEPDELAALRSRIFGFVFQRYNLLSVATAAENVEIPAIYRGVKKHDRATRAQDLLAKLGLGSRGNHRPNELSGGQQQRVAIARALMNDPPVILADEPTGALDSNSGRDVMALLKSLHAEGRTVILITHDEKVAENAERVIRIADGKIVSSDVVAKMGDAPRALPSATQLENETLGLSVEIAEAAKTALRALHLNIFRTALTLLGIVIGVAAVIIMLAVGNGSKQSVLDQISAMGTNLLSVRPGAANIRSTGDIVTLTYDDAKAVAALPNVDGVLPERSGRLTLRSGNKDYMTSVSGTAPGLPAIRDWPMARGSFFTADDMNAYAPVIVLGQTTAHNLFGDADPIGQYVVVRNIPFQVVGVLSGKGATPWGADQDDAAYVPLTTALARLYGKLYISNLTVKAGDTAQIDQTQDAIKAALLQRHRVEDFQIRSSAAMLATAMQTQNTLTVLLGAVAAISLLVGGIGVMNIMLVSVTERTREIGIRMAVGARARDIMLQFNTEAAVVCTIGGIIGVALGFLAGWVLSLFDVKVIFTAMPAIIAFSCAFLTGLVFGWLPARKAAAMDPVVAAGNRLRPQIKKVI